MASTIEGFSRATAGKLLHALREARLNGEILDVLLLEGSDWQHPQTAERIDRARTLEGALETMLERRAGTGI